MSLRLRLTLLVACVMSVLIALAATTRYLTTPSDAIAEARSNLQVAFDVLPDTLSPADPIADGTAVVRRLSNLRHVLVEFHGPGGELIAATRTEPALTPPRRFASADREAWPQPLVREFVADGRPLGSFRVIPDARDEMAENQRDMRRDVLLIAFIAVALGLLVFWAVSRALRPIERIHQALMAIEEGRLETRLQPLQGADLSAVGTSFNRMATGLEGAVRERQRLLDKLLTMEEQTRRMIAHDLHDELTPYLVAVRPHLSILESAARSDAALGRYSPTLTTVRGHLDATVARIRHLLESLHPPELEGLSMEAALDELIRQQRSRAIRPVTIELTCEPTPLPPLPATVTTSVFRIVQESITNAYKHSDCSALEVHVAVLPEAGARSLLLDVQNNGRACDQGLGSGGFGVLGIRERAMALGGSVAAGPLASGGWRVRVTVPLETTSVDTGKVGSEAVIGGEAYVEREAGVGHASDTATRPALLPGDAGPTEPATPAGTGAFPAAGRPARVPVQGRDPGPSVPGDTAPNAPAWTRPLMPALASPVGHRAGIDLTVVARDRIDVSLAGPAGRPAGLPSIEPPRIRP